MILYAEFWSSFFKCVLNLRLQLKCFVSVFKFENKSSNSDFSVMYSWMIVQLSGIKKEKHEYMVWSEYKKKFTWRCVKSIVVDNLKCDHVYDKIFWISLFLLTLPEFNLQLTKKLTLHMYFWQFRFSSCIGTPIFISNAF